MADISAEDSIEEKFRKVFRFDASDLAANRNRELSGKQKRQMLRYAIFAIVFFGVVIPAVLFAVIFSPAKPEMRTPSLFLVGFISLPSVLVGMGLFWQYWQTYKSGNVLCLSGTINFRDEKGKLFLDIDEESIPVSGNVQKFFQKDIIYNVYYADLVRHIMSVESVP